METDDPERTNFQPAPASASWQFSLRALLVAIAIASVVLAILVYYAGALSVVLAIALIQVVMLFVGDWLIRPQNRRALAFVTAASWAIVGSGFVMVGIHEAYRLKSPAEYLAGSRTDRFNSASAIFLLLAGAFCYFLAGLRWRQLNAQRPTKEARA